MLIAELERGLLRGEEVAGAELVLQELRRAVRSSGLSAERIGSPARQFFQPLEPFLVDDALDHKHHGRIARAALDPIWAWLVRDVVPAAAKAYADDVTGALIVADTARADILTRAFQDRAAEAIAAAFTAVQSDERARRKLAAQIGTPRAFDDVQSVLSVLQMRDAIAAFSARLPTQIRNLTDDQIAAIRATLDAAGARDRRIFLFGLLVLMSRLALPSQLTRLATAAAESDKAARVAESPYGVAVTIVLDELERMARELREELKSGRGVAVTSLLKSIHDGVRGLRTEMDLPVDTAWGRQLAAIRAEISGLLKAEIESVPARVRRLLRPRAAKDIPTGAVLDAEDVAEAETMIAFVAACRNYASELAVNEITMRVFSELQQYLDTGSQALLDGLRHAASADRPFRQSQVDAAVRFCGRIFGQDYASALAKAAEVAANAERKAAAKA